MIFIVISIFIAAYSFIDYKRAMTLFLSFRLFWCPSMHIMDFHGFSIGISTFMDMIFIFSYLFWRKKINITNVNMPYIIPLVLVSLSCFITAFVALNGFLAQFKIFVFFVLENVVFIYLIWKTFEDKKDLIMVIKVLSISLLMIILYGFFEYFTHTNPIIDYKRANIENDSIKLYSEVILFDVRGYRMTSVMEHPIGFGMTLGLFVIFYSVARSAYNEYFSLFQKILCFIIAFLSVICIILTKMRSSLLFFLIGILAIVNFKKKSMYYFTFLALAVFVCIYPIFIQNSNVLLSLFDKNAQEDVGGSSWNMRLSQLDAVVHIFQSSPVLGLGENFSNVFSNVYTEKALGYESVWFMQMPAYGIIGVIVNVILLYYSVVKIPMKYKSKAAFFLSLSYWVVYTLTSVPAFKTELYYLLLFYFIKKSDVYAGEKIKCSISDKKRIQKKLYKKSANC